MSESRQEMRRKMIQLLKEKADSYVPEWRFDEENPDIGTALCMVYADMAMKTTSRLKKVMEKNERRFLNLIGADVKPAQPSKGYINFSLVNQDVPGTYVEKGSYLTAECKEAEDGKVYFRTKNDVYVTPSQLACIYEIDDKRDYVGLCYDTKTCFFDSYLFETVNPNYQEHEWYIAQDTLFYGTGQAVFCARFIERQGKFVSDELIRALANPQNISILYWSKDGFIPFAEVKADKTGILMRKEKGQPEFENFGINGKNGCVICLRGKNIHNIKNLCFQQCLLEAKGENISPDFVLANDEEVDLRKYAPFGERLSMFNEVCFASDEVFGKKGAKVTLAFVLSFIKIPFDTNLEDKPEEWKWVMDESETENEKEYETSIASVLWEYYNGTGFRRLIKDDIACQVFANENGGRKYVKLSFLCPEDIEKVFVGHDEAYVIKARITKLCNPYKMNGYYLVPILEQTALSYTYEKRGKVPDWMMVKNNLQMENLQCLGQRKCFPFKQMEIQVPTIYLGFTKKFEEGPVKILFSFQENVSRSHAGLSWEYFDGSGWEIMNVVDETRNFSKTGIITFNPNHKAVLHKMFGRKQYWIRIKDIHNYYRTNDENEPVPHLNGIYMNSVNVENLEPERTEFFCMEYYQKQKQYQLMKTNIAKVSVWVKKDMDSGMEKEWEKWTRVTDFCESGLFDHHYMLDAVHGLIIFGDGKNGCIPKPSSEDNIKVVYQCGGGEYTNVDAFLVNHIDETKGFINGVVNPQKMIGGTDPETINEAVKRCEGAIRHQNRAVTALDYEMLVREASRNVCRVKCISGTNENGKKEAGAVTLVVLTNDYQTAQGMFPVLKEELYTYLKDRVSVALINRGKLFIRKPIFVEFRVHIEIYVSDYDSVFLVKNQVHEKLDIFLDPISGNFNQKGFLIGQLPNVIQIQNAVAQIIGLKRIGTVFLELYVNGVLGKKETSFDKIKNIPFTLPVPGKHEITVFFE